MYKRQAYNDPQYGTATGISVDKTSDAGYVLSLTINDGKKLEKGTDYDSESGSTKITIKSQTLDKNTKPGDTNTIATEVKRGNQLVHPNLIALSLLTINC